MNSSIKTKERSFLLAYHFQKKLLAKGNLLLRSVFTIVFFVAVNILSVANIALKLTVDPDSLPSNYFIGFSIIFILVFLLVYLYYKPSFHEIVSKDDHRQSSISADFKRMILILISTVLINVTSSLLIIY